ncbi:MAG TPA: helix-turn-helix domain-containing protein [Anaerolineales bacterium]|nr:helix-turn-helix domain-containing protein [Anaerolineales bacterium]
MPETIGQRLKQTRLSRQISIEKAAEATRVRAHYLQALEADNYSAMSSAAQSRGFLRLYADFLGLDLESAMTELREGETVDAPPETPAPASVIPTPVPVPALQTPPASAADGKPVRRPFWARLLRRSVPDEPAAELEPAPEVTSPVTEEPASAPTVVVEPVTVPVPEPELKTVRAKKKASSSAQAGGPKTSKPKSTPKADDKKKASLKSNPAKKR